MQRLTRTVSSSAGSTEQWIAAELERIRPPQPDPQAHSPATRNHFFNVLATPRARMRARTESMMEDLTSWNAAGHAGELRSEAVEIILNCMQRRTGSLCLSHLGLSSIPECVGALTHLDELALDHNRLSSIPDNIEKLQNLKRLNISDNRILEIPERLCDVASLESIKASNNEITRFPQEVTKLTALRNLQLDGNLIESIPPSLYEMGRGTIVFIHGNPLSPETRRSISRQSENLDYSGPAIFQQKFKERRSLAYERDPFVKMSNLERIEELLGSAEKMSDGRYEAPVNFRLGGRNMNKKECLLMALEISLESHRELTPAISYRLLTELPTEINQFLVNSVSFDRDRIKAWAMSEELSIPLRPAREVIDVENSLMENGPEHAYNQDQNVHDARVHGNFVRQFHLIESRIEEQISQEQAATEITSMIHQSGSCHTVSIGHAVDGLDIVMARHDLARGFEKSPADTLAMLWTYIGGADPETKANLHNALCNRLAEIGSGHICGLGMTERIIDIPTAVDWSVTNSISFEHLHTEIAKMASDVNEEFESKFGDHADLARALASNAKDASCPGDTEQRINEIKRDMFRAKARVELVSLRNLDEGLVSREVDKIFDAAMMRERI